MFLFSYFSSCWRAPFLFKSRSLYEILKTLFVKWKKVNMITREKVNIITLVIFELGVEIFGLGQKWFSTWIIGGNLLGVSSLFWVLYIISKIFDFNTFSHQNLKNYCRECLWLITIIIVLGESFKLEKNTHWCWNPEASTCYVVWQP